MKTTLSASLFPPPTAFQSQCHSRQRLDTASSSQADIYLMTKEGDTINIQGGISDSSHQKMTSYGAIEKSMNEAMTVEKYSITVNGDLNEQELADLLRLLDTLSTIAEDFFTGHTEAALAGANTIGDMGSIAKLEANFSQTTAIRTFLKGPHPMPDMQDMLMDEVWASNRPAEDEEGGKFISMALQAQWQQFIEYFNNREDQEQKVARTNQKPHELTQNADRMQNNKKSHGRHETAKQMFHEAKNTMSKNPRLTPLIPSIAHHAIDKSIQSLTKNADWYAIANSVKDQFSKEYSDWLI